MRPITKRIVQFVIILLLLSIVAGFGQTTAKPSKATIYNAIVKLSTQKKKMTGIFEEVTDSAIYLLIREQRIRIPAKSITQIVVKTKGAVGRSALLGGLAGGLTGLIAGFASGDDECNGGVCWFTVTAEEKGIAGAIVGSGIGVLAGVTIAWSSAKEKLMLNGAQNNFENNIPVLKKYTVAYAASQISQ